MISLIWLPNRRCDAKAHKAVAEIVERALVLCKISAGQTVAHHHIRPALAPRRAPSRAQPRPGRYRRRRQAGSIRRRSPENMRRSTVALALLGALCAQRPRRAAARSAVPSVGIVVIDIDSGLRQRGAVIGHDLRDRARLVITGDQHGDAVHGLSLLPCRDRSACHQLSAKRRSSGSQAAAVTGQLYFWSTLSGAPRPAAPSARRGRRRSPSGQNSAPVSP